VLDVAVLCQQFIVTDESGSKTSLSRPVAAFVEQRHGTQYLYFYVF
jgi:hypothetical protein